MSISLHYMNTPNKNIGSQMVAKSSCCELLFNYILPQKSHFRVSCYLVHFQYDIENMTKMFLFLKTVIKFIMNKNFRKIFLIFDNVYIVISSYFVFHLNDACTYSTALIVTLAFGPLLATTCWCICRAAKRNATSYFNSGANLS